MPHSTTAQIFEQSIVIEGMSCASCVARVEKALKKIAGVTEAQVNLATEKAHIQSTHLIALSEIIQSIQKAGFNVATTQLELNIVGMSCASCVARVEKALNKVNGVISAEVNLATEKAHVHMLSHIEASSLIKAIQTSGFDIQYDSIELSVEGMSCASCVGRVEKALLKVTGVTRANVNLATEQAIVEGSHLLEEELIKAVEKSGFTAKIKSQDQKQQISLQAKRANEADSLKHDFYIAFFLALPVFLLEMGGHLFPAFHHFIAHTIGTQNSWYLQWILTTLVLLIPGRRFYQHGIPALWRRAPDMNSLVAIGTLAAYSFSCVATFFPNVLPISTVHVYFEAAAVIVALILLGRYLEAKAKGKTSQAIQYLIGLQPKEARVKQGNDWVNLPVSELKQGMIIAIKPGEKIAVDGEVIAGESYVDEAMISGEPHAVFKHQGDQVIGGTINQNGSLDIRATRVGQDSVLAHIIQMVEHAQGAKLPIQTMVDKVTLWFVPVVMGLALFTFILWFIFGPEPSFSYALVNAVAVLIIACPCAMGLATPTSIMVGTGRAAELGVLFRKGDALQRLQQSRVVAVDKTGTLTEGKPELTDLEIMPDFTAEYVLQIVASVEAKSEHPIAHAIVQAANTQNIKLLDVTEFNAITGAGIQAKVLDVHIYIGAEKLMQQWGIDVSAFKIQVQQWGELAKTPIYVAIDQQLAAIIAVSDPIKSTTYSAIQALHAQGLKVAMMTGDNAFTAHAVAKQLHIDHVVAELLPQQKVDAVSELQHTFGVVAFVGDGINDAPALAQSDVGIAVGTGTDIAIEAADVVLMSGNLQQVATAIAISHATMTNIKQNLFWAFVYNMALIPIAAGILYPFFGILLSPMFAAAAMALSSVFVISNALRLKRFNLARFKEQV
ncbi:heavy metal translocating P-type ATPase [Acinetobacter wanghuae]|uniref:P-type Cu(+) transporter n=1 Tax=Acinetobacter wanghuae TaxID=2662362 RepID=A0A5Q0P5S0_9GAMM|nr:heavy metal translocating P-type ATPase [Acinetobacter wanghuae]MQW92562.1 heavy metal translocating P-type ATPase [Acinetobacter wanghuae]QGA11098.1 heavy metal translocating P-type ATPase [Acinetobacter wanghuae]